MDVLPVGMGVWRRRNQDEVELSMARGDDTLPMWRANDHAEVRIEADGSRLVLRERAVTGIHAMSLSDTGYVFRRLTLTIVVRPLPGRQTGLCVRQDGFDNVAFVTFPSKVHQIPTCESASVEPGEDGFVTVTVTFVSRRAAISICTVQGSPIYLGSGEETLEFKHIFVGVANCDEWFDRIALQDKIALVDVGAAFGLQPCWLRRLDRIRPVLFEPNPAEAAPLIEQISRIPGSIVVQSALADRAGMKMLAIARYPGCTSLLKPNTQFLAPYKIARTFETIKHVAVDCVRYDSLVEAGTAPLPDVIKLDVQGFEYEVLQGFGATLQTCLGVELEAHLYPIYQGQKLLGDLVRLLEGFGLMLQTVAKVEHFDGDLVELNAWFTPGPARRRALSEGQAAKLKLIRDAWALT